MADRYGALPLTPAAPAAGEPVTDPALFVFAAFLQAVLNARLTTAWQAVSPADLPVAAVFHHNPEMGGEFRSNTLPALYCWREASAPERIADGYEVDRAHIVVLWVFPQQKREYATIRRAIFNGIAKVADAAITQGRDPAWVLAGDPDTTAATRGSVLLRHAQCLSARLQAPAVAELTVEHTPSNVTTYPAIRAQIEILEREVRDPSTNGEPTAAYLTFTTPLEDGGGELVLGLVDLPAT